ncbi:MAG: hypothetical protein ABIJ59_03500 [Pseudomonadota bacterium]
MIEIICDQYELYSAEDFDILITETSQFEDELVNIKNHAESGESLRVIVRNPALFDWFDAAVKYGAKKRIIDPVSEFAKELNQHYMPDYLKKNPHWVVELHLFEKLREHPVKGESADKWLKRVLLGDAWIKNKLVSPDDLSEIFLFWINRKGTTLHPLEKHLITEQHQSWSLVKSDNSALFAWLKENPFNRAQYIVWEQLLSLFPEDKISVWLQPDHVWYELTSFPNRHQLPRLDLKVQLPESITTFATAFLEGEWNFSPDKALSFISGDLDFENNFLIEQLRQQLQNEVAISPSIYEKLMGFKKFPKVISLARQLLPAKKPSGLVLSSSIGEVQDWTANEYLPFYNSCALLGLLALTESYVREFEVWLEHHYTDMLFGQGMAFKQISKIKEHVIAGESVLIFVFDGLDYLCARDELLPAMQNKGFFPSSSITPYFSFLPTQTYVAKPALVAGKMKSQIPDELPNAYFYKKLLQEYLGLPEDDIRSLTDRDGNLLDLIQKPAKAYLYLDNHLDQEFLHKNYRQHLRGKKYGEYVQKKAEEISQCVKDFKNMYGKSLQASICSDHGYTIIPKNSSIIDVTVTKSGKTRTLFASETEKIDELDQDKIWELNSDLYGLNDTMIIPRGYACFNKRPQGATHGGCTPQEMAVPWFFLSEDKPEPPKGLSFLIEGEIFRKRIDNMLTVIISNLNQYPVTIVKLDIEGMDLVSCLPKTIDSKGIGKLESKYDASNISESYIEFLIYYYFRSPADELEQSLTITVPTIGAMTTEFDDDFEF